MGILKALTVSSKRETNGTYSVLLQKIPATNQPSLVFEAGAVALLDVEESTQIRKQNAYTKIIDGYTCLGVLQFAQGESKNILYLVLVTGCVSVGKIQHSEIFRVTDTQFLSLRNSPGDSQIVQGVRRLFNSGAFYFSYSTSSSQAPFDLTLPAQRAHLTTQTDNRFFWNRVLFRHFERYSVDTSQWLAKVLCGGVCISTVYIGGSQARACLISRLSCERAGTRFNVRGVNDNGHVANFVETEQVIFVGNTVLSYLIVRGSIPLFWEQPGIQVGSHRIRMSRGSEISQPAYDKHMLSLRERFTNVHIVNLLGTKESEIALNQLFNAHHKASTIGQDFQFVNFDYHTLCPRGNKDNLEKLFISQLSDICDEHGFFYLSEGEVKSMQKGVYRVNCLDCLDRTNSFQTFIGLKMINRMMDALERDDIVKILPRFRDVFETSWIQNGDQISRIYTGTGALEGKSILKDGTLSVARTIQNNLLDGSKQCAIDILTVGKPLDRDYAYRSSSLLPYYFMLAPPNILISMCDRYLQYCYPEKIKIAVATWNVNGGKHFDNILYSRARPVSDWLIDYRSCTDSPPDDRPVDIYAIGFQEIVDLNASNIVAASGRNQRDWLVEIRKSISRNDQQYLLVTSVQLVGVCLFVFIRAPVAPFIKDVNTDQVKTGLGGATGNKGGVAIRLRYKATSMCFVCAHFAAGQNQIKERNDDYTEIARRLQFSMGRSINSHDYIFWCGDFNYRLDKISNEDARRAIWKGQLDTLLEHDQLKIAQKEGNTFKNYLEGDIIFAPTYKYDMNSNDYDSSEKCRIPAWTDRILFRKRHATHLNEQQTNPNQIKFYNRIELLSSDHRPVIAEYEVEVLNVDNKKRNDVFESVLEECGPPDSTVLIRITDINDQNTYLDIGDGPTVVTILKMLADEAGEIVLARFVDDRLRVTFRDGKAALKAFKLNGIQPSEGSFLMVIEFATKDWAKIIKDELSMAINNTVNLLTGEPPSVILDDDEDETAQQLNMSIGPQVEPDSFCIISNFIVDEHLGLPTMGIDGIATPASPKHQPTPPPPGPPTIMSSSPSTSAIGNLSAQPPSATAAISKPNRPPLPLASNKIANNSSRSPSPMISNFDNNNRVGLIDDTNFEGTLGNYNDEVGFADTSNLMELSSICDYESQPPPTLPPPPPPPIPSEPPIIHRNEMPHPIPPRPMRAAPPPPIPARSSKPT